MPNCSWIEELVVRGRSCILLMMVGTLLLAPVSGTAAEGTRRLNFNISAGSMDAALMEFRDQAGLNIEFDIEDVKNVHTEGVAGLLDPPGALSRILEGTSLCSSFTRSGRTVSVTPCAPASLVDRSDAGAGSSTPAPSPAVIPLVVISGSNIHQAGLPGLNVVVISREDLAHRGIRTTAELIDRLPELGGQLLLESQADGNSGLGVAVNLRGQGAAATLILINGHRLASSGTFGSFQDFSNIPLSAVQRLEIVLDGASAQYGTDSVGGLINIITVSQVSAPEFGVQLDEGLGARFQQIIMNGLVGGHWGSDGDAVLASEYDHATPWKGPNLIFPQTTATVDRVPGKEFAGTYARVRHSLPGRTQLIAEGIYAHRHSGVQYDVPVGPLSPDAVSKRTGVSVQMTYLSLESQTEVGKDGVLVIGLNRATETERQRNWPLGPVKFTDGTTESSDAAGVTSTWFNMRSRTDQISGKFDRSVVSYGAGSVKALVGIEYRKQSLETLDSTSPLSSVYDRTAFATFGEVRIPIAGDRWAVTGLQELELSIAARRERYSDFNGRYTPQCWLRWKPIQGIELIANWGRSSEAPTLSSLDPSRNSITLAPVPDSQSENGTSRVFVEAGNNPRLTGQTATSENLGARIEWPFTDHSNFKGELNVFRIHFFDRIPSSGFGQVQLGDPTYAPLFTRNVTPAQQQALCLSPQFYGNVAACLASPAMGILDLTLRNIDALYTEGLQVRSDWGVDLGNVRAGVGFSGAYYFQLSERITPNARAVSLLRTQDAPAALQVASRLWLGLGDVELGLLTNSLSGFWDGSHHVPTWTTFDVQVQYAAPARFDGLLKGCTLTFMVRNLLDRELPIFNDASINQNYGLLGGFGVKRILSLGVQKHF